MFPGGILASKSASPLLRQGFQPLAQSSSRLKPTGKNESFFKPFHKSYNIKPVGIVIIYLSLLFLGFLCVLCVLCGLIIPIQPETI